MQQFGGSIRGVRMKLLGFAVTQGASRILVRKMEEHRQKKDAPRAQKNKGIEQKLDKGKKEHHRRRLEFPRDWKREYPLPARGLGKTPRDAPGSKKE